MADWARIERALTRAHDVTSDFDLNPEHTPPDRVLKPAGVLMAIEAKPSGAEVILTRRASHLKAHAGQVAFPGGREEPEDGGPIGAALREAEEEIGLPRSHLDVLGTLPPHRTVTDYAMTPVVARLHTPFTPVPEEGEVAEVFRVPLDFLTDPANFRVASREYKGSPRYFYEVPYGDYYIWGATARVLRNFAEAYQ